MIEVTFWWRERPDAPAIGTITFDITEGGQESIKFSGGRTELDAIAATEVIAHPDAWHEVKVTLDGEVPAYWLRAIPEALDTTAAPVRGQVTHDDHVDPDELVRLLGIDPDALEVGDDWPEEDNGAFP